MADEAHIPTRGPEHNGAADYYQILGVERGADANAIVRAYKLLARQLHPDKNLSDPKGAADRFQRVSEAYTVINDAARREIYDEKRDSWLWSRMTSDERVARGREIHLAEEAAAEAEAERTRELERRRQLAAVEAATKAAGKGRLEAHEQQRAQAKAAEAEAVEALRLKRQKRREKKAKAAAAAAEGERAPSDGGLAVEAEAGAVASGEALADEQAGADGE